ncbi:hypothetical protein BXT84_13615 [Sulfobacillus thermotolerans]|uniref:Metallo-beta-lactamase domain-containing protein n=1 Tax=Sulfobacillus thermotolerans TaxID=338644 RepID=A0ABM6RUC3_9FIRM|nr:hypothetical protein BXT84_13615 [Sulfobacillus thermotolerans]
MESHLKPIVPNVWQTAVPSATIPPYQHTHCYWIQGRDGMLLVDTADGMPEGTRVLQSAWEELGKPDIQAVYMTHGHADHVGGAVWAVDTWDCDLWLHSADFFLLSTRLRALPKWREIVLQGGRLEIAPGVILVEAPGHTPGQVNVCVPAQGLLLAGDNLLGNSTSIIIPPHGHLRTYLETLDRLAALDLKLAAPAHGDLIENPHAYIAGYRTHRYQRLEQIVEFLREKPQSASELAERIYPEPLQKVGTLMVMAHLEYLAEDQKIRSVGEGRYALPSIEV